MKDLIFLHGFASDSNAFKAKYLNEKLKEYPEIIFHRPNFNSSAEDFQYKTITGMIARLREYILANDLKDPYIIASSLGGIVALNYVNRFKQISGMLLLAPMTKFFDIYPKEVEAWKNQGYSKIYTRFAGDVHLSYGFRQDGQNYLNTVAPIDNTKIIHGKYDGVVPFVDSLNYCREYGLELISLNSNHTLSGQASLDSIWLETKKMLSLS